MPKQIHVFFAIYNKELLHNKKVNQYNMASLL